MKKIATPAAESSPREAARECRGGEARESATTALHARSEEVSALVQELYRHRSLTHVTPRPRRLNDWSIVHRDAGTAWDHPDGSHRSELRWNSLCASADHKPLPVRVVEYTLPDVPTAAASYRLVTAVLDPTRAPAEELAALYHECWEMEPAFDELKTHLRGARRVLRSKTPDLVQQEAWGFLLAHFAPRALMHEAALGALPRARGPDTLSFTHALRVTRRMLPHVAGIPPQERRRHHRAHRLVLAELRAEHVSSSRGRAGHTARTDGATASTSSADVITRPRGTILTELLTKQYWA